MRGIFLGTVPIGGLLPDTLWKGYVALLSVDTNAPKHLQASRLGTGATEVAFNPDVLGWHERDAIITPLGNGVARALVILDSYPNGEPD